MVSMMFNDESGRDRTMMPESVPVGVDCTLTPLLPSEHTQLIPISTELSTKKSVVCSPDLPPVYSSSAPSREYRTILPNPETGNAATIDPQPQQPVKEKVYHCPVCGQNFTDKGSYLCHVKHHGAKESEEPYQCNFCGKTFAVPARLTRHYRTHTGEKPYQCEFCNKSFSVKENLSVHKRIHTKERPYKCDVCERAFEHSGKLHRHMRIHTGERPHKCEYCSKTFIQSGQLVIHLRTHTGEKPYVCKSCGKGFTCSKQLKVHTRTHTGEKPYACDICGKSFGYNHVLKLHQVAHYGEKVYKCTICKETFSSKKSMETHIKLAHSESAACTRVITNDNAEVGIVSVGDKENNMDLELERIRTGAINPQPELPPPSPAISPTNVSQQPPAIPATYSTQNVPSYQYPHAEPEGQHVQQEYQYQEYYFMPSPSPSESSRSSSSPRLEIVEYPARPEQCQPNEVYIREYITPDYPQPQIIDYVPPKNCTTPPTSVSPASSSSSDPLDVAPVALAKEEIILPHRKRSKAILQSMEKAKIEIANSMRQNSVIQYARAS